MDGCIHWLTGGPFLRVYEELGIVPDVRLNALKSHVPKQLPGLDGLYMAGQWVEPGGGVPMAVMSGRQVVELVCAALGRPFVPPVTGTAAVS